mmetsp:Transcript_23167/g.48120  ORF Transcript_23167/g.48120 Transcript_23167/m.48120 type:complete len:279 (-) Transcript_23167:81-917(-)
MNLLWQLRIFHLLFKWLHFCKICNHLVHNFVGNLHRYLLYHFHFYNLFDIFFNRYFLDDFFLNDFFNRDLFDHFLLHFHNLFDNSFDWYLFDDLFDDLLLQSFVNRNLLDDHLLHNLFNGNFLDDFLLHLHNLLYNPFNWYFLHNLLDHHLFYRYLLNHFHNFLSEALNWNFHNLLDDSVHRHGSDHFFHEGDALFNGHHSFDGDVFDDLPTLVRFHFHHFLWNHQTQILEIHVVRLDSNLHLGTKIFHLGTFNVLTFASAFGACAITLPRLGARAAA